MMRTSDIMNWTVVVQGGMCQRGDEGAVIGTEMDSGGVGRNVSKGRWGSSYRD